MSRRQRNMSRHHKTIVYGLACIYSPIIGAIHRTLPYRNISSGGAFTSIESFRFIIFYLPLLQFHPKDNSKLRGPQPSAGPVE